MRYTIQLVASILLWLVFGWYWYLVMQRQLGPTTLRAVGLLLLISLAGLAATLLWVAHNQRLAARNRRRGAPPGVAEPSVADHLGRPLAGPGPEALRAAKVVVITIDDQGRKVRREAQGVGD